MTVYFKTLLISSWVPPYYSEHILNAADDVVVDDVAVEFILNSSVAYFITNPLGTSHVRVKAKISTMM